MGEQVRSKKFRFTNELRWRFERIGEIHAEDKSSFRISSPPEFRGEAGHWTPEDLFVSSANACLMLTFLAAAEREEIRISSYESTATGTVERVGNTLSFTDIKIEPVVGLDDSSLAERVEQLLHESEKNCLIGNSIKAILHLEPRVLALAD